MDAMNIAKRDKLKDILRLLIANPGNVNEVADELSHDWFPMMKVDALGKIDYVLGTGHKK